MAPVERTAIMAPDWPLSFLDQWRDAINADLGNVARARHLTTDFLFSVDTLEILIQIRAGRCQAILPGPHLTRSVAFALRGNLEAWSSFWEPSPAPGFHDIMALVKTRTITMDGDLKIFLGHLLFFKAVLAIPRVIGRIAR